MRCPVYERKTGAHSEYFGTRSLASMETARTTVADGAVAAYRSFICCVRRNVLVWNQCTRRAANRREIKRGYATSPPLLLLPNF